MTQENFSPEQEQVIKLLGQFPVFYAPNIEDISKALKKNPDLLSVTFKRDVTDKMPEGRYGEENLFTWVIYHFFLSGKYTLKDIESLLDHLYETNGLKKILRLLDRKISNLNKPFLPLEGLLLEETWSSRRLSREQENNIENTLKTFKKLIEGYKSRPPYQQKAIKIQHQQKAIKIELSGRHTNTLRKQAIKETAPKLLAEYCNPKGTLDLSKFPNDFTDMWLSDPVSLEVYEGGLFLLPPYEGDMPQAYSVVESTYHQLMNPPARNPFTRGSMRGVPAIPNHTANKMLSEHALLSELLLYDGPPVIYTGFSTDNEYYGVTFDYDHPPVDLCKEIYRHLGIPFDPQNPVLPQKAEKNLIRNKFLADLKEALLSLFKQELDQAINNKIEIAASKPAAPAPPHPSGARPSAEALVPRKAERPAALRHFELIAEQPEKAAEACCYIPEVYKLLNTDGVVQPEEKEKILHFMVQVLRDENRHVEAVQYAKDLQNLAKGNREKMLATGQLVSRIHRDTVRAAGKNKNLANERLQNAVTNGIEVLKEAIPRLSDWCDCLLSNNPNAADALRFDPQQLPQDFSFAEKLKLCFMLIYFMQQKTLKKIKREAHRQSLLKKTQNALQRSMKKLWRPSSCLTNH